MRHLNYGILCHIEPVEILIFANQQWFRQAQPDN